MFCYSTFRQGQVRQEVPRHLEAGYEAYRVDQDPCVSIPIEEIEKGIRSSDACLADITLDNPNVWFELGMALAASRDVVLICSDERNRRYPFDVQHRKIISYASGSVSDFQELRNKISERLGAIRKKQSTMKTLPASATTDTDGLSQHELVALISIAQNMDGPGDRISAYVIRKDMENCGYTKIAGTIALNKLLNDHYVEHQKASDTEGDTFSVYGLTTKGMQWLINNQEKINLRIAKGESKKSEKDLLDDDMPF